MTDTRLFQPLLLGKATLLHRVGMAPLTRLRASEGRVPNTLMKEYYTQRAAVPGTFILTEGTIISQAGCGAFPGAPGIWSEEQVAAWSTITDAVHQRGCVIYCQLFHMGRAANKEGARQEGIQFVGPSVIAIGPGHDTPEAMTVEQIQQTVHDFAAAAKNAIRAGFDGVEFHGANGYLVDQFLQSTSNQRTDAYGGSVENRARLAAIGADRVGFRLSPYSPFQGMCMDDPVPQFAHAIQCARALDLAYLHLVEPRISGANDNDTASSASSASLDFAYQLWDKTLLVAGGYGSAEARQLVDKLHPDRDIVVIFGRHFIANPDLVYRLKGNIPLSPYQRQTFYSPGAIGYVDYPCSDMYVASTTVSV